MLLASSEWMIGMPLNILQYTWQPFTAMNDLAPNASSPEVEKPCFNFSFLEPFFYAACNSHVSPVLKQQNKTKKQQKMTFLSNYYSFSVFGNGTRYMPVM